MTREDALRSLIDEIRRRPEERALMDAPTFWARLDMIGADANERSSLANELRRRELSLTEDTTRNAVYLVWMGRPLPSLLKARREKQDEMNQAKKEKREAALSVKLPTLDLGAASVRAVSIRQPYAELILQGRKTEELRTWPTPTGPLLIHVSGTVEAEERRVAQASGITLKDLTFGALVGIVDVVQITGEDGNYAWLLARPRRFTTPIPYKGALRILAVPMPIVEGELREVLGRSTP